METARLLEKLKAIAQTGLAYSKDPFELAGSSARTSIESSEVAFFDVSSLPELSIARVTARQIARCLEHHRDPSLPTDFD